MVIWWLSFLNVKKASGKGVSVVGLFCVNDVNLFSLPEIPPERLINNLNILKFNLGNTLEERLAVFDLFNRDAYLYVKTLSKEQNIRR